MRKAGRFRQAADVNAAAEAWKPIAALPIAEVAVGTLMMISVPWMIAATPVALPAWLVMRRRNGQHTRRLIAAWVYPAGIAGLIQQKMLRD